jgi:uncharacterized protein (TIGR02118 family)
VIKVIVMVKRHPRLTPEAFHRHWREVHARLVSETPSVSRHIIRYEQNHRTAEDYARGDVEFDGVAVAWYESREELDAVFEEPEYKAKIAPDEAALSDAENNVWIVTEEEEVIIDRLARGI